MALYKLAKVGVIRSDGAFIPKDNSNRDYIEFLRWVIEGNTPDPADPDPVPATDLENATLTLQRDPVFRALVKVLAAHFGLTVAQLVAEIKAQV